MTAVEQTTRTDTAVERKKFTIHEGDAGSEAYRDEYVRRIERDLAALVERNRRLVEALNQYGCHVHNGTTKLCSAMIHSKNPCDCGLDAIKRELAP